MFTAPIGTAISPEKEVGSIALANNMAQLVDHKSYFFARNQEPVHPSKEMLHSKIFSRTSKRGLEDEATDSSLRRIAVRSKLTIREKLNFEIWAGGLTAQLKC